MRIVRDLPSWWHARRTRYAALAAGVVALVVAVVLVVPGGEAPKDALSTEDPTPTANTAPSTTPTPDETPTGEQLPSAEGSTSSTSSPAAHEPVASDALLLPTSWVDATFGHGRPQHSAGGAGYDGYCQGEVDHSAGVGWSWPEETMLLEDLRTARSEAAAKQLYDSCTDSRTHPAHTSYPVRSRALDVGDEAVVIRTEEGLVVETVAVARVGTTVVWLVWLQSGRVESDVPAERALHAAVAQLLGRALPAPEPAPAPEPVPETRGYLGAGDLKVYWSGDSRVEGSLPCRSPNLTDERLPPAPSLRLATPAVIRWFFSGANEPEFGWEFLRGRAPDEQAARDDFAACRAALSDAKELAGVGDEAFCSGDNDAYGGIRCLARVGDTYFLYVESTDWFPERARTPLQLAISRDPDR